MENNLYRSDIDGLRAVAVLSVVFHHLNPSVLPGGFVGVDIFFVISGYLITAQIYKDVLSNRFSFKLFYQRRINRIIPGLFFLICVTLLASLFLLSPADLILFIKGAVYAFVGASNVFFWHEYGNYFSGNAGEAPLLHTWSLGVEEQFYLIWPLLIVLISRLGRIYFLSAVFAFVFFGVLFSEIFVGFFASASYYLLPTRFFELSIGGALALLAARDSLKSRNVGAFCAVSGMLLVGASVMYLHKKSSFPGFNALWPCMGAALLIWSGHRKHLLSWFLCNRFMVSIGLISYSLYLWHWPFIAYANYLNVAIGLEVGVVILLASIAVAWVAWRFVENPMRKSGLAKSFSNVFFRRFFFPLAALAVVGVLIVQTNGLSARFDRRVAEYEAIISTKPDVLRSGCHVPTALYETPPEDKCRLGKVEMVPDRILVGDSFANHFSGMVDVMAKAEDISVLDYTMDGCPPILSYVTDGSPSYANRCLKRNQRIYSLITEKRYAGVILAGNWPRSSEAGILLKASLDYLLNAGISVTIILGNEGIENANSCLIRKMMYRRSDDCASKKVGPPEYFSDIISRYSQVRIVDPNEIICQENVCSPILEGIPIYRDSNHLNDVGARLLGRLLVDNKVKL